jgi:N-acetylmuramoyl-L-alanine amidase
MIFKVYKILVCCICMLLFSYKKANRLDTLVIDAGHGGHDRGTIGSRKPERQVALEIALKFGELVKANAPDVKVVYTRKKDVFIPLSERSAIANKNKADLFVSIHCNANPHSTKIFGTETYAMGLHKTEANLDLAKRENESILFESDYKKKYKGYDPNSPIGHIMMANYQSAFLQNSLLMAGKVEKQFKSGARKARGVKQAGFLVLWETTMPSILVETGYMSNPAEDKFLCSEEGQNKTAKALLRAFLDYKKSIGE